MNTDRRAILSLVANGRITASEAERMLAAWSDSRETAWVLMICLVYVCLAQLHLHELVPGLVHFFCVQILVLNEAVRCVLSQVTELIRF
jgi:hypothetical protein